MAETLPHTFQTRALPCRIVVDFCHRCKKRAPCHCLPGSQIVPQKYRHACRQGRTENGGFLGAKPQTGIMRGCPMQILSYFSVLSILSGEKPGFLKNFLGFVRFPPVSSLFLPIVPGKRRGPPSDGRKEGWSRREAVPSCHIKTGAVPVTAAPGAGTWGRSSPGTPR